MLRIHITHLLSGTKRHNKTKLFLNVNNKTAPGLFQGLQIELKVFKNFTYPDLDKLFDPF
jgi:hypothetical protein